MNERDIFRQVIVKYIDAAIIQQKWISINAINRASLLVGMQKVNIYAYTYRSIHLILICQNEGSFVW